MDNTNKKRSKRVHIKSKHPIILPKRRKFRNEEMKNLLQCLMENGHKNFDKLQEAIPGRSLEKIKTFMRTLFDNAAKLCEGHANLDPWIKHCTSLSLRETAWENSLQIAQVVKYLSVDGLLENHPLPQRSQGIDFGDAYRLIYQALMGYPIQPVNEPTATFIQEIMKELTNEVKKEFDVIQNVNSFLIKKFNSAETEVAPKESLKTKKATAEMSDTLVVKKPLIVYQRKRPKNSTTGAEVPPLKIVVEANDSKNLNCNTTREYAVTVEGNKESTIINVPVPLPINNSELLFDKEEKDLLGSNSYNPFKIPEKWLHEPLFVNAIQKL